jgi:hypothetical protein
MEFIKNSYTYFVIDNEMKYFLILKRDTTLPQKILWPVELQLKTTQINNKIKAQSNPKMPLPPFNSMYFLAPNLLPGSNITVSYLARH